MANFTAADVKKLRELTGSGMKACKDALVETEGDFDKAVEILRVKGAKDVGKRAERTAAEGLIAVSGNTMVEVNSETDFVAKNSEFIEFANKVAEAAAKVKVEYGLDDLVLVGYDDQEETLKYIRDGVIYGVIVQDPYTMGYLGVKNLYDYLTNGKVENEHVDTGTITVTLDNIDTYK